MGKSLFVGLHLGSRPSDLDQLLSWLMQKAFDTLWSFFLLCLTADFRSSRTPLGGRCVDGQSKPKSIGFFTDRVNESVAFLTDWLTD